MRAVRAATRRDSRRRRRLWLFNAVLTLATLVLLVLETLPLPVIFLIACAVALVVNYPDPHQQRERLTDHGSSAMVMVTTVMAAGLFSGIMTQHRDVDGHGAQHGRHAAVGGARAPAGRRRGDVDADEPGVRPRLVLFRRAAGSRQRPPRQRADRRSKSDARLFSDR